MHKTNLFKPQQNLDSPSSPKIWTCKKNFGSKWIHKKNIRQKIYNLRTKIIELRRKLRLSFLTIGQDLNIHRIPNSKHKLQGDSNHKSTLTNKQKESCRQVNVINSLYKIKTTKDNINTQQNKRNYK